MQEFGDQTVHREPACWTIVVELFGPVAMATHGAAVNLFFIEFRDLLCQEAAVAESHMSPLIVMAFTDALCGVAKGDDDRGRCSCHIMIGLLRIGTIVGEFSLKSVVFLDQGFSPSRLGQNWSGNASK